MSANAKQPANLRGLQITPPGPATWISHPWRMFLAKLLTCLMNPRITVLLDAGDGITATSKDAEIVMAENGWTATVDLTKLAAAAGASLELTDGTTDLTGVSKITVTGATVGGTPSNASLVFEAAGTGFNFRGVWSPGTYNYADCVQIGTGTSAGLYLCLLDGNQQSPDTGYGWVQISSFATWQ